MTTYLGIATAALILSRLATVAITRLAAKYHLTMPVRPRDQHDKPTPRIGGVAMFAAFWLVIWGLYALDPAQLSFIDRQFAGIDANLFGVFLASVLLLIVHLYDDMKGLKPAPKFAAMVGAGALLALFGIRIWWLSNPLGGPNIILDPWQSHLLVIAWTVLIINVVNFLDGLDGLAAGVSGIAATILLLLALEPFIGQSQHAILAAALLGVVLGFLPANIHPAKIFMGDSGSTFLGLMLAVLSIISGAKVATAFLVLGIAIIDALWVVGKRAFSGRLPWTAGRDHLHHKLLDLGMTHAQIVYLYWGISALLGYLALRLTDLPQSEATKSKVAAIGWLGALMLALFGLIFLLEWRKKWQHGKIS
jgi:UDP-GlcNAc:undecaprenyl-phosphate GlcNAc-1-phosphate transferase